jgi:hypothetical protein
VVALRRLASRRGRHRVRVAPAAPRRDADGRYRRTGSRALRRAPRPHRGRTVQRAVARGATVRARGRCG